jgi:hypothetical protein
VPAPLPLLDADPEGVEDTLAFKVMDTLGDTELETLALEDFEALGGALADLEEERQVEMEGVGEERLDSEVHALAVGQ